MKVLGINHVGLAAKDPVKARWFLKEVLQLPFEGEELVAEQKTNTVMFMSHADRAGSPSRLEILENQPGQEGPIAKFLEKKGGGIHHVALTVDNVEAAIAHMKQHDIVMIDETPRNGAHGTKIAFVHPQSTGGLLVELVQQ